MTKKKEHAIIQAMQLFEMNPNHSLTPVGKALAANSDPSAWAKMIKKPGKYVCLPYMEILKPGKQEPVALDQIPPDLAAGSDDDDDDDDL